MALVAVVMALSMFWSTAGPAQAGRPYDRVPAARHRILGQHLTNHHTHMETWIVGWFSYERRVRIHHHWRRKTFYGLRISAQHCTASHCWGRVVTGRLWSPHQPGRPLRREGRDGAGAGTRSVAATCACRAPPRAPLRGTGSRATSTSASRPSSASSWTPAVRDHWRVAVWC